MWSLSHSECLGWWWRSCGLWLNDTWRFYLLRDWKTLRAAFSSSPHVAHCNWHCNSLLPHEVRVVLQEKTDHSWSACWFSTIHYILDIVSQWLCWLGWFILKHFDLKYWLSLTNSPFKAAWTQCLCDDGCFHLSDPNPEPIPSNHCIFC